jgi:hypothetical protein
MGGAKQSRNDSNSILMWTERLQTFAAATGKKERAAALPEEFKKNPGGTIRDLYHAWAHHFGSARGPKRSRKADAQPTVPPRERLNLTLKEMFGKRTSPVRSLYAKLAGRTPVTIRDADRIVAAIITDWPKPLGITANTRTVEKRYQHAKDFAEIFIRELLSELTEGRSLKWTDDKLDHRVFTLIEEERIGARQFVKDAGEKEGALIVAGSRNILVGTSPVDIIRQFHDITSHFVAEDSKGILIFVLDAAMLDGSDDRYNMLYNLGILSIAMSAFALFQDVQEGSSAVQVHHVDWTRWRAISSRCCLVMRRPPLVDPSSGMLFTREEFDAFVAGWKPHEDFEPLPPLHGFMCFDSEHVLPRTYPTTLGGREGLSGHDLYWDVLVRPTPGKPTNLRVEYFVPPPQRIVGTSEAQEGVYSERLPDDAATGKSSRGRPLTPMQPIEEDTFYVARRNTPGAYYDEAQRAIYLAARGRLKLDTGTRHDENLLAAAALRQIGYEVLPVSVALCLLPRSLHFATAAAAERR